MSTLDTPAVLLQLIDRPAVDAWPHKKPSGTTRRRMVEDAIRQAARLRRFDLKADLVALIGAEFPSNQATRLHSLLAAEFAGVPAPANQRAITDWQHDLRESLRNWIRTAIWQYTDFRKLLVDSWAAAVELPDFEGHRQRMADCVWADVADTFAEAVTSGQAYMLQYRKDASERFGKARNGLAKTVDSVLEAAREFSTEACPRVRRGISDLSNAALAGLFEGFSRVTFHDNSNVKVDAYELFRRAPESWVDLGQVLHLLGYASRPLPSFVRQSTDAHGVEWTLCEGLWRATRAIATPGDPLVVLPSATRGRLAGPRLEFFVSVYHADTAWSEQLFTIFLAPVTSGQHIRDLTDRASRDTPYALIVVRQLVPDYDLCRSTPFTQVPELPRDTMAPSAAQVDECIRDGLRVAAAGGIDRGDSSLRNFAVDFPLDEAARISERYLVERPSVHDYVMRVVTRPGLYLNCGMRRSGKTTAFHPDLLKRMGVHAKEVVAQTCRANGQLGDSFFTWLRKTYRDEVRWTPFVGQSGPLFKV